MNATTRNVIAVVALVVIGAVSIGYFMQARSYDPCPDSTVGTMQAPQLCL